MDQPSTDRVRQHAHALAEAAAEYGATGGPRSPGGSHRKLSISLPADLLDDVHAAAAQSGVSISGVIAAALRRTLETEDQARLERALALDAEDNAAWAKDALALTARAWADLEW